MTLNFRYKGHKVPNGFVYRPEIPVRFIHKDKHLDVMALIDSGADTTTIPKGLAEYLQLDLTGNRHKSKGVGGSVEVVESCLDLTLSDPRGRERYILERIPAQVNLGDDEGAFILLGRGHFFNEFEITFREPDRRVTLKKINPREYG